MSRLPAEWEHQSGVQLTWPHPDTAWEALDQVLECYVEIAATILRYEPLMIVTRDIEECKGNIADFPAPPMNINAIAHDATEQPMNVAPDVDVKKKPPSDVN